MPFINEINFNDISTINGVTIDAGGGDITSLTDWNTRLAGSHSEGDYAVWSATGAVYRWAAGLRGGNGDWVRQEAYSSSYAHEAYLDGAEANDTELLTKGWTSVTAVGNGSIDYDGTRVVLSGTSASTTFDQVYINNSASSSIGTGSYVWICGQYTMQYEFNSWTARLGVIADGSYRVSFNHSNSFTGVKRVDLTTSQKGTRFIPDSDSDFPDTTTERHFAFYATPYISADEPGMVLAWVDHSLVPMSGGKRNLSANSATSRVLMLAQDAASSADRGCALAVRNYTAGII